MPLRPADDRQRELPSSYGGDEQTTVYRVSERTSNLPRSTRRQTPGPVGETKIQWWIGGCTPWQHYRDSHRNQVGRGQLRMLQFTIGDFGFWNQREPPLWLPLWIRLPVCVFKKEEWERINGNCDVHKSAGYPGHSIEFELYKQVIIKIVVAGGWNQ